MKPEVAFALGAGALLLLSRRAPARRRPESPVCDYESYWWSTSAGRPVDYENTSHPWPPRGDEVSPDDARCSICESDQVWVRLPDVEPFRVCWSVADELEDALLRAIDQGAVIESVTGYRPGRTVGRVDSRGRRTGFGPHAYGLGIDINADYNGFYSCTVDPSDPERVRRCGRAHGGPYDPERYPRQTITRRSPIYVELTRRGWVWGGDVADERGYLDLMHFDHP